MPYSETEDSNAAWALGIAILAFSYLIVFGIGLTIGLLL